jgi:hypothetical protein
VKTGQMDRQYNLDMIVRRMRPALVLACLCLAYSVFMGKSVKSNRGSQGPCQASRVRYCRLQVLSIFRLYTCLPFERRYDVAGLASLGNQAQLAARMRIDLGCGAEGPLFEKKDWVDLGSSTSLDLGTFGR